MAFNGTQNFSLKEMRCKDGSLVINDDLINHANRMQKFRDWYKRPMTVNSWYRSKSYNAKIGGASGSYHVKGMACDIAKPAEFYNFTASRKKEFIDNCRKKWHEICGGTGCFIDYDTFMHFDSRTYKRDLDYRDNKNY